MEFSMARYTCLCPPVEVLYELTVQYTRQCNFTYIRDKSTVLPAPIFTKFANAQHHCLQICYTDLYLDSCGKYEQKFIYIPK